MKKLFLFLITGCLVTPLIAQNVSNIQATFDSYKVLITYDLSGTMEDQEFKVEVFSSHDDFQKPLERVTGAVGNGAKAGKGNKILWDAAKELPIGFEAQLVFRVVATLEKSPWPIYWPTSSKKLKRGKTVEVKWLVTEAEKEGWLVLYNGEVPVATLDSIPNTGTYTWAINKKTKPGTYILRYHYQNIAGKTSDSMPFRIRRKIPWALKIAPFLPIAAFSIYMALPKELPLPMSPED